MPYRDLKLLDAAARVADLVNKLIAESPRGKLLHVSQLRDAVGSIGANIKQAFGRDSVRARDHSLDIARGETEEAIQHMKVNFRASRVAPKRYWEIHNLLVVTVKMLTSFLRG